MSETSLYNRIKAHLKKQGCEIIKVHGTQYARKGEPDLIGCSPPNGGMFVIETKLDYNKPTAIQIRRLKDWRKAGASVGVAYTLEDAIAIAIDRRSQHEYDPPADQT